MGKSDTLAALNLEFPDNVPRTEYSAHFHWELVQKVTGIDTSILENRKKASSQFIKQWDYGFFHNTQVRTSYLTRNNGRVTNMGHAVYSQSADGKEDFNNKITNPFSDIDIALDLDAFQEYGLFDKKALIDEFEIAYLAKENQFPGTLNLGGVYITMFSGLIEIFGWDTFLMAVATDMEKFGKIIESYYMWVKQFFEAYAQTNIPVILSHDDLCWTSGPVMHPEWYRKYIFPYIKKLWQPLKESGKKIIFNSDGNWTEFFDDIVNCGADMVIMEPCADMELFANKYGKTHGFVGNASTQVLLFGNKEDIYNEVKRCMDIGKKYPGFIMAVGNHIPPNTPVENAIYYNEVYEALRKR